jgi:hypothetical protein
MGEQDGQLQQVIRIGSSDEQDRQIQQVSRMGSSDR